MMVKVIQVDASIIHLVPVFLESVQNHCGSLQAALTNNDYETIQSIAHKLKGEGGMYGFPYITEVGGTIEDLLSQRDMSAIKTLIKQLTEYINTIEVHVQATSK